MTTYSHTAHHETEHEEKSFQLSPALRKKILISVIIFHFFVIVLPYLTTLIARWLKPPRPKGMVVKLIDGLPGAPGKPAPPSPNPTPTPEPSRPQPIPVPKPVTEPTVKPIAIKPPPKEPVININKIRKITVKRPKPKPEPTFTPLTAQQLSKINEQQNNGVYQPKGEQANAVGNVVNPGNNGGAASIDGYFDSVGSYLYSLWRHPSKTELGDRKPTVTVHVAIDASGKITSARIVRASGIRPMDNSVLELLNRVRNLPKPPNGSIDFDIDLVVEDE